MRRVVVLGRGAAGKSHFARDLAARTALPLIELDQVFWSADLVAMSPDQWTAVQARLAQEEHWIMDGDLGPYDVLEPRLSRAEVAVVFDLSAWRCSWRAVRRSRERLDFWRWLLSWRRRYRPILARALADHPALAVRVVRSPTDARAVLADLSRAAP